MLPPAFLTKAIAHRGLWDRTLPENSLGAIVAAVEAGYGAELDLQLSADGEAMVFHDETLDRMTGHGGWVCETNASDLQSVTLGDSDETIPTLQAVLQAVAGRAPLLIEMKDQLLTPAAKLGPLERHVAELLKDYTGDAAVMSFNPDMTANMRNLAPSVARGITGCDWFREDPVPDDAADLNAYSKFEESGSSFVSHDWNALQMPAIADLKARGVPILCWTVRSQDDEKSARKVADNITFEKYRA